MKPIEQLADLLLKHEETARQIAALIKKPAHRGHIGEFIAMHVFAIDLVRQGNNKGSDGVFRSGNLAGRSVNVKFYSSNDRTLDVNTTAVPPDFYLVLTGPRAARGLLEEPPPLFALDHIYLFEHATLLPLLKGLAIGAATSVRKAIWDAAEVYPNARNAQLVLTVDQRRLLKMFEAPGGPL